jgi:uncharacterized membrane protein
LHATASFARRVFRQSVRELLYVSGPFTQDVKHRLESETTMDYSIFLDLHVTAVIVWVVSMLVLSVSISASAGYGHSENSAGFNRLLWINRYVTTPFMALTWILGVTLAVKAGWFGASWLSAKLVFVVILSAVHGVQTKTLRKLTAQPKTEISIFVRLFPVIVVFCGLIIVWLVLTKPF